MSGWGSPLSHKESTNVNCGAASFSTTEVDIAIRNEEHLISVRVVVLLPSSDCIWEPPCMLPGFARAQQARWMFQTLWASKLRAGSKPVSNVSFIFELKSRSKSIDLSWLLLAANSSAKHSSYVTLTNRRFCFSVSFPYCQQFSTNIPSSVGKLMWPYVVDSPFQSKQQNHSPFQAQGAISHIGYYYFSVFPERCPMKPSNSLIKSLLLEKKKSENPVLYQFHCFLKTEVTFMLRMIRSP